MDNNNGPNMTPMNPNKESPMTTTKNGDEWMGVCHLLLQNKTDEIINVCYN